MQAVEIDGLFNVRVTDIHSPWLVRTGTVDALSDTGAEALRTLGASVIVDLREDSETAPSDHGIPIHRVNVYGAAPPATGRLEDVYEALLRDRAGALTAAVAVIADAEGAAVVHCTAGKDRTGLVVALALLAAGASRDTVIADYALSGERVQPVREAHAHSVAAMLPASARQETLRLHLDSPREAMEHALGLIDALGGAAEYLRAHGLSDAQLQRLRAKCAAGVAA